MHARVPGGASRSRLDGVKRSPAKEQGFGKRITVNSDELSATRRGLHPVSLTRIDRAVARGSNPEDPADRRKWRSRAPRSRLSAVRFVSPAPVDRVSFLDRDEPILERIANAGHSDRRGTETQGFAGASVGKTRDCNEMEKSYRDLFDALVEQAAQSPSVKALVDAVGEIDDLDPLRIPALKAMKREPTPPLALKYVRENGKLVLYARNTVRKRRAPRPAFCADIPAFPWLFDVDGEFQGDPRLRPRCAELVRRSFGYLGIRIANYFEIGYDNSLVSFEEAPGVLTITAGEVE